MRSFVNHLLSPSRSRKRCLRTLLLLAAFFSLPFASHSQTSAHAFALLSPAALPHLKAEADTPVAQKALADANGHLSTEPHPMARLHTEGTLPHQGIRDQSIEAERDFQVMADLGFAFRFTGDRRYLDAEARYLSAWSSTYQPSLNPIDETRFDTVFIAFDLTRDALPAPVQSQVLALFRTMATGYLNWWDANAKKDPANWSSHRIKLMTLSAYELNDATLIHRAAAAFRAQIAQNIRPDGEVVDFKKRDALHYVTYDLEPLTTAALAAKMHGQDWFHTAATGSPSVEMGINWLLPFALGQKTHEEFVHSGVGFDAARARAGEQGYSGQWHPAASVELLALAAWADPRFTEPLRQVEQATDTQPAPWLQLCIAAEPGS
jgi:hypothetical protein